MSLAEEHLREFTRSCVRSGLLTEPELYDEVAEAVAAELPELAEQASVVAKEWVAAYREELAREEEDWPEVTDYDRLQEAFAELSAGDVVVLQGCDDHWAAKEVLDRRAEEGAPPRGVAWFTPPDVWHAVDEGMLEVNVWHGNAANVAAGDTLLDEVLGVFARHGLHAHFDEGRVEVSAHWQRRLSELR